MRVVCDCGVYAPPGIHPRLKQPVGQRLALGALHAAYGKGSGAVGGVIQGCALGAGDAAQPKLTLSFDMKGRCVLLFVVLDLVSPALSKQDSTGCRVVS